MIGQLLAGIVFGIVLWGSAPAAPADKSPPLTLETKIALPNTSGRIDYLDIDLKRKRLFVVELGNGSVDVVDLGSGKVVHRISGLDEPQGVVYVPKSDLLAVASGGDGTLRVFSGSDFARRGMIKLGDDADNVRLDPRDGNIVVGYGSGDLAIVDPEKAVKLEDIRLPDHPEAFQLSPSDGRAYERA
jgi:DNA-binding beta-propeller fold protein YncE